MGAVLAAGGALWRSAGDVRTERTAEAATQVLTEVADPLQRLCEQDPSVRARVGRACDTAAVAVSAVAESGAAGLPQLTGAPGTPGVPGVPGVPGAVGPSGAPGASGQAGPSGAPGASGQAGAEGPSGAPGATGAAGPSGAPGAPGRDAQLPVSYTEVYADGTQKRCTRNGGPDTDPTYDCQAVQ